MRIRAGIIIIFSAVLLIVMATLYPFAFTFKGTGGGLRDLLIVGIGNQTKAIFWKIYVSSSRWEPAFADCLS